MLIGWVEDKIIGGQSCLLSLSQFLDGITRPDEPVFLVWATDLDGAGWSIRVQGLKNT